MDWSNLLMLIFGGGGALAGLATWSKARPEKISYEIKNMREIIEELKTNRIEDKKEAAEDKAKLEKRLSQMEERNNILEKSIQQFIKCRYLPADGICPVADFVDRSEDLIKKAVARFNEQLSKNSPNEE